MNKSKLVLALAAASMLPGLASAAAPTAFGSSWALNADGVTVDYTCAAGFTCDAAPISDDNFLQVQMTDNGTGVTYFQTIVATSDATDTYNNESFVVSGATAATGGIAASQSLRSASATSGTLDSTTTLNIGTFKNASDNEVALSQDVWDTTSAATAEFHSGFGYTKDAAAGTGTTTLDQQIAVVDEFTDRFDYVQSKNLSNDTVIGTSLDIVSGVVINDLPSTVNDQSFRFSLREGDQVTAAGSGAFTGGTTTWATGDKVSHVLVGQSVDLAGSFGYERVSNETAGSLQENNEFSLSNQGPFATIASDPFGTLAAPTTTVVDTTGL